MSSPISDDIALRIGLAARALPETSPSRLLKVLADAVGLPPTAEKPMTEKQKDALYTFIEGQPIPDELAKAALADTKAALTAAKAAPKAKK